LREQLEQHEGELDDPEDRDFVAVKEEADEEVINEVRDEPSRAAATERRAARQTRRDLEKVDVKLVVRAVEPAPQELQLVIQSHEEPSHRGDPWLIKLAGMEDELNFSLSVLKAATNDTFHHLAGWARAPGRAAAPLLKVQVATVEDGSVSVKLPGSVDFHDMDVTIRSQPALANFRERSRVHFKAMHRVGNVNMDYVDVTGAVQADQLCDAWAFKPPMAFTQNRWRVTWGQVGSETSYTWDVNPIQQQPHLVAALTGNQAEDDEPAAPAHQGSRTVAPTARRIDRDMPDEWKPIMHEALEDLQDKSVDDWQSVPGPPGIQHLRWMRAAELPVMLRWVVARLLLREANVLDNKAQGQLLENLRRLNAGVQLAEKRKDATERSHDVPPQLRGIYDETVGAWSDKTKQQQEARYRALRKDLRLRYFYNTNPPLGVKESDAVTHVLNNEDGRKLFVQQWALAELMGQRSTATHDRQKAQQWARKTDNVPWVPPNVFEAGVSTFPGVFHDPLMQLYRDERMAEVSAAAAEAKFDEATAAMPTLTRVYNMENLDSAKLRTFLLTIAWYIAMREHQYQEGGVMDKKHKNVLTALKHRANRLVEKKGEQGTRDALRHIR
jgi:hypothetical protein